MSVSYSYSKVLLQELYASISVHPISPETMFEIFSVVFSTSYLCWAAET